MSVHLLTFEAEQTNLLKEQYGGWQRECLKILRDKYDTENRKFAPDQEILEALQQSAVGHQGNFKQTQKLCMLFLRYKKDEVMKLGVQALDLRLPFGEIQENLELVKRQTGLEHEIHGILSTMLQS